MMPGTQKGFNGLVEGNEIFPLLWLHSVRQGFAAVVVVLLRFMSFPRTSGIFFFMYKYCEISSDLLKSK